MASMTSSGSSPDTVYSGASVWPARARWPVRLLASREAAMSAGRAVQQSGGIVPARRHGALRRLDFIDVVDGAVRVDVATLQSSVILAYVGGVETAQDAADERLLHRGIERIDQAAQRL